MSDRSAIEWTGRTWNPVTGCDRASEGCDHCYALTLAKRLKAMGNPRYQRDGNPRTSGPGFGVTLHHDKLFEPMSWRRPRPVFVNSMSDLFHPRVPDQFIFQVFQTMARAEHHVFQVLTKRHARLAAWTKRNWPKPLPNVWLGVSIENQRWADRRIPRLLEAPAAVRFLSCEPLLESVDLTEWLWEFPSSPSSAPHEALHWIIVGGESGPSFRRFNLDWARSIRDQCVSAGVPFFFKQVGGRTPKAGGRQLDGREWGELPAVTPRAILEELGRKPGA